jgi:hypothetical protein
VVYRLVGMWAIKRAIRILREDDAGPLSQRLTREARRILVGAAITVAVLVVGVVVLIGALVALAA